MAEIGERLLSRADQDPVQVVWGALLAAEQLAIDGDTRCALDQLQKVQKISEEGMMPPTITSRLVITALYADFAEILRSTGELETPLTLITVAMGRIRDLMATAQEGDRLLDDPERLALEETADRLLYLVDRTCGLLYFERYVDNHEPTRTDLSIAQMRLNRALETSPKQDTYLADALAITHSEAAMNHGLDRRSARPAPPKDLSSFRALGPMASEVLEFNFA